VPEGDTIHKLARLLGPELEGVVIERVTLRDHPATALTACRVRKVFARGKHLFLEFDGGVQLRSHLGLHGSWHRYRLGETWRRPRWQASIVLELEDTVLVCFNAKEIELLRAASARARQLGARLGPDLAADETSLEPIPPRARTMLDDATLAVDVLLDQRIASGIGNVYKSEVLFLEAVGPRCELGSIDDATLRRLYQTARDLLRRNLGPGPRTTRFAGDGGGILWVYGRAGLPCLRCGTPVVSERVGRTWRSTYWCPACQDPAKGRSDA
jgi:endonuclease-8